MSPSKNVPLPTGFTKPGFEAVLRAFSDGFQQGKDKGSALAIYHKGSVAVSLWGGFADEPFRRPWQEETFGHFWSGTKFMSSAVIASLVDRGLLNYEEKVSTYWPEFAQNKKENITLNSLLSHSAGVSVSKQNFQLKWMREDPRKLSQLLASMTPLWEPGSKHGYSAHLIALFLNEIVKRVDLRGRSLSEYFHEEIAKPFGIDFHIGLPKSLYHKACRTVSRKMSQEEIAKSFESYEGDMEILLMGRNQPSDFDWKTSLEDPDFASLPSGATNGMGTAKAAAKFAGILGDGGVHEGKAMLSKKAIKDLQEPLTHGIECVLSERTSYGRGTQVFPAKLGDKTWFLFGHTGYGGQIVLTDPAYQMGFAYCTNYMEPFHNFATNRWRHLLDVFYKCVGEIEGIPGTVQVYEQYGEFLKETNPTAMNSKL